jgi:hypothetical protein
MEHLAYRPHYSDRLDHCAHEGTASADQKEAGRSVKRDVREGNKQYRKSLNEAAIPN